MQELGSAKTYERIFIDERSFVNINITAKFSVDMKENKHKLPTLYWLPKLHKQDYKTCFILSQLLFCPTC